MSNRYLLLQLHISKFSVGPGWHFTALYVCASEKGRGGNSSEENQNPHSRLKAMFIWFPLNLPHQAPWSVSAPLIPLVCDSPQLLTQSRASPTLQCHPHLNRYAIKTYKADLRHLGAEISSDSTVHTLRTENSLEATKENGCPWHHSARIWFSLFSRKSDCDHHLSGQKQFKHDRHRDWHGTNKRLIMSFSVERSSVRYWSCSVVSDSLQPHGL